MDKGLIAKDLDMMKAAATFGINEAHRRSLVKEVIFFSELGLMRDGDIETLSNGRRLDYRVGALPAMWELLVLDYNN
jgi:ABC-type polysaccharide/polyol phosphate transport system ATPase subunit